MPTLKELREEQARDGRIKAVGRSLMEAITEQPSEEQQELLSQYAMKDGLLYFKRKFTAADGDELLAWVIEMPQQLTDRAVKAAHEGARVEHLGAISTYQMLPARYNWPSMCRQIRETVLKCAVCQVFGKAPNSASLGGHITSTVPGEKWVVDLLHIPKEDRYELTLVMVDVCSRWAIARPVRDATSAEVARSALDA